MKTTFLRSAAAAALLLPLAGPGWAQVRVAVGTMIDSAINPYQESNAMNYSIGCQTYGCLATFDSATGEFEPMLAESWENVEPTKWVIHLRDDVLWDNGEPVTAADVVHSYTRLINDPASRQGSSVATVETMTAMGDFTVEVITTSPDASAMDNMLDRLTITNAAAYEAFGAEADTGHRAVFGPYRIVDLVPGQYVAMERWPESAFAVEGAPDEFIVRNMKEPEQRVTALLTGEIQIAQYVPPHMVETIESDPEHHIMLVNGIENNFLAMNPGIAPWDNEKLRQAVAYAIDRDVIIEVILGGMADRLDGPIGEGQIPHDPDLQPVYTYDPDRARELLAEAGYPDGIDVDFVTSVNRYVNDKQTSEAIVQMLADVGIRATMTTPERTAMSADVNNGLLGFYYFGRGSIIDAEQYLSQYFVTGVADRLAYSDPEVDDLLIRSRAEFDADARAGLIRQAMSIITEEAPAAFLWRMKMIYGVADNIEWDPPLGSGIYANDIVVR